MKSLKLERPIIQFKIGTASPPALLVCCNVVSLILGHLSFQINVEIMELISLKYLEGEKVVA